MPARSPAEAHNLAYWFEGGELEFLRLYKAAVVKTDATADKEFLQNIVHRYHVAGMCTLLSQAEYNYLKRLAKRA